MKKFSFSNVPTVLLRSMTAKWVCFLPIVPHEVMTQYYIHRCVYKLFRAFFPSALITHAHLSWPKTRQQDLMVFRSKHQTQFKCVVFSPPQFYFKFVSQTYHAALYFRFPICALSKTNLGDYINCREKKAQIPSSYVCVSKHANATVMKYWEAL